MGQGNHPKGTGMPGAERPSTIILFPSFSRASSRCVFVCSQLLETRVPSRDRGLSPSSALSSVIGHKKLIIRPESHFPFLKRPSLKRVFFWQKGLPAGKPAARVLLQQGLGVCQNHSFYNSVPAYVREKPQGNPPALIGRALTSAQFAGSHCFPRVEREN